MILKEIKISTSKRNEMINITQQISDFISENSITDGILTLFVPHTTAAVTINENADPSVKHDILFSLSQISPIYKEFEHLEGNSDAHVKASLIGNSEQIIVYKGKLINGIWQGIYFCEFDGPRNRTLVISFS